MAPVLSSRFRPAHVPATRPRAIGWGLLAALVLAAAAAGVQASGADGERFTLAMLRADGIMLPFAAYDGRRWSAPWPAGVGGRLGGPEELPANLESVPESWWGGRVPPQWKLWPRAAAEATPLEVRAPIMLPVGRMRRLGLRTSYPAGPLDVSVFELPFPKVGIAIGGDATLQPIASVSRLAPAGRELLQRLQPDIEEAETATINALNSRAHWKHPADRPARAAVVPELEAWYSGALVQPGFSVYYIEAVKRYAPRPEDRGCGLESFISGWVHANARNSQLKTQLKVVVSYCDREKVSYMLPFGELRVGGRTHWVFQMSGQDHEWYAVAELTPGRSRTVAEYYAGGIPTFAR